MASGPAIGIDLGTTYSCVAYWADDRVEIIANDQGNRTTPSFVAFTTTERLVGDAAKNQVAVNAANTVYDVKRLIGRHFSEPSVQRDLKHFSYPVVAKGLMGRAAAAATMTTTAASWTAPGRLAPLTPPAAAPKRALGASRRVPPAPMVL